MLISPLKKDNNPLTLLKDARHGFNTSKKSKGQNKSMKTLSQVLKKLKTKKDKLLKMLRKQWANQSQNQPNQRNKSQRMKKWMLKHKLSLPKESQQVRKLRQRKCKLNDKLSKLVYIFYHLKKLLTKL